MRSIRLYIDAFLAPQQELALPAPQAAHAVRVLRLRAGDTLTLFNGDGHEYAATLEHVYPKAVRLWVHAMASPQRESPLHITLAQALVRGEKMDWIVQKATELGVARIVPLVTERSEVRLDATRGDKRLAHWRAVAASACEQCGRNRLPVIDPPQAIDSWTRALAADAGTRLHLHPDGGVAVRALTPGFTAVCLAVGPEGGFGERDLVALNDAGFAGLVLGPRVLRTETAGLAALAALQSRYGDC